MADAESKPQGSEPEQLARLLELELIQKRAGWQCAAQHRNLYRALAFLFLVVVIVGALAAYFFFFSDVGQQQRARDPAAASQSRSP